jgi:hypothetical protein
MQRVVALTAIVLLFAAVAAPGVEAFLGCAQACPDDDAGGRCADGMCCSCCMYAGPVVLGAHSSAAPMNRSTRAVGLRAPAVLPGEPVELLHVPKTIHP